MTRMLHMSVAFVVTLLSAGMCGAAAQAQERRQPVVEHIDHIMIRTDKPEELYAFFIDTLQLPAAWPLAERGGVTSGGVGFGNVNIEAIKFPAQSGEPSPTHLVGFAFKPVALEESLAELRRRGIPYGEPRPFVSTEPDGTRTVFFTNVTLSQFSDADRPASATRHVFISEYDPAYVDAGQRRARLRRELAARAGGPLGIVRVEEIVVGTPDVDRLYERLLEPETRVSGAWRIGDGPAIRLVRSEEDLVQRLVIGVVSLERARRFLEGHELLGSAAETQVAIAPSKIHGVSIVLIEAGAADDETRSR